MVARQGQSEQKALVDRIRAFQRSCQANKRCADCTERGPTYVCLDFRTFICQTCSGIHREFGHKIKGISLSEWSSSEVDSITTQGNEEAALKWMGRWKAEEMPEPDSTDLEKVREFIKAKYEEKRWVQLSSSVKVPSPPPTVPTAPPKVATVPAAPQDLLGSDQSDSVPVPTPPVAAASMPPLFDLDLSSSAIGPGSGGDAPGAAKLEALVLPSLEKPVSDVLPPSSSPGSEWTADFGTNATFGTAPDPGGATGGLMDLDLSGCSAPELVIEAKGDGDVPLILEEKKDFLLDVICTDDKKDFLPEEAISPESSGAEPAEEPAPALATPDSDDNNVSLGDRLREAVLNGSTDDMHSLFKQCIERPQPSRAPASVDRLNSYAAFDELCGGATASAEVTSTSMGSAASPKMQPAQVPEVSGLLEAPLSTQQQPQPQLQTHSAGVGGANASVAAAFPLFGDASPSLPSSGGIRSSAPPVAANASPATGAPAQTPLQQLQAQLQSPSLKPQQEPTAPLDSAQLAQLMVSQKPGMLSPQQLEGMNPQELLQMQMMISQALTARSQQQMAQAQASGSMLPLTGAGSGSAPKRDGPFASAMEEDSASQPRKEFGDLLAAFSQKNFGS